MGKTLNHPTIVRKIKRFDALKGHPSPSENPMSKGALPHLDWMGEGFEFRTPPIR